ncbi:MAG: DUF2975 domain-containing protein [Lachnospiraceae bacterium]|nr:DUF2975 domain-containing protein [Lachnospiraceae bacterium]
MEQRKLAVWLKAVMIGLGVIGAVLLAAVIPYLTKQIGGENGKPMVLNVWIWISGIPPYIVLFIVWKIADSIGKNQSFTFKNAKRIERIAQLAAADSLYWFIGLVIFLFRNEVTVHAFASGMFVVFAGVCIAVVAALFSHLVQKAAVLQNQEDLTI